LADVAMPLESLEGVAVSAGPGSFTGLRAGIAFAKGLAFAGGLPLVGVSTLEANACQASRPAGTLLCVANDARRGEVYAALFRLGPSGEVERCWPDRAWRPADLLEALPDGAVLAGDACRILLPDGGADDRVCVPLLPSGGVVACLGAEALARGERARLGEFEPTYVRAPDLMPPRRPLR
jgi:tRNA threonylcarbamoyladenosine biosynthesis protein TsaB